MPDKKQQQPAIRRFTFRHDPTDTRSGQAATATSEATPDLNESETQATTYTEHLAEAERKAGRKVTRVRTRRVRVMTGYGISPNRLQRPVSNGTKIIRTFIFK